MVRPGKRRGRRCFEKTTRSCAMRVRDGALTRRGPRGISYDHPAASASLGSGDQTNRLPIALPIIGTIDTARVPSSRSASRRSKSSAARNRAPEVTLLLRQDSRLLANALRIEASFDGIDPATLRVTGLIRGETVNQPAPNVSITCGIRVSNNVAIPVSRSAANW